MAETLKAKPRRIREGFFDKYIKGIGIDIGASDDPITDDCDIWEKENGDAVFMAGVPDNRYDFVYSSHCLEHLDDPWEAIRNWWRILKSDGYLIIAVPNRHTYEKKKYLPSRFNEDHKWFFQLENHEKPHTLGLKQLLRESLPGNIQVYYCKECSEGWTIRNPLKHSNGEYQIEAVVKKL
jgi:SAM-dependent methyltransferase